jgi:hypothetical protein
MLGGVISEQLSSKNGERGIIELRVWVGGGVDESAGEGL